KSLTVIELAAGQLCREASADREAGVVAHTCSCLRASRSRDVLLSALMRFDSLQDFIHNLERRGDLKRVRVEVDPELEVTEITQRVLQEHGPALLFERPKGSSTPLVMNLFGRSEEH